ncbi:VWA domain-containing protein [Flavobacteriaceae bacterium D16]|nr:VWA domain-containing protein [Flavobacteriaceae bacterium D16]
MPENFEIANIWIFWLLPLPLLFFWLLPALRLKSASLNLPNFQKSAEYTGEKPRTAALVKRRNFFSWLGMWLIWILTLAALASPRLVEDPELKIKTSRNFLILADISFSMAEEDWEIEGQKSNRWQAVKHVLHDFIRQRKGDRMGLIFFGSSAYIQAPFTPDLETVEQLLEEADVGMAGQMTNIGKAIVKGNTMFQQDTIKTKVMLLLTDGVDSGTNILPLDAADLAVKDSILIYTIGIGDPNSRGSDLDEKTLKEISNMTGASYFRAIDTERLSEIYAELDTLEPIEYEEEEYKPVILLYQYPLGLAVLLAIVQLFIGSTMAIIKMLFKNGH